MSQQSFPITEPTLYDVLHQIKDDIFANLRVAVPGQVISFDGTHRTASIRILLKRVLADGSYADYQPLATVPVWTPQGGGAYLQFPVAAGDQGIVLFMDRNIGAWFQNGSVGPMPDLRAHTLSDGVFIPGLNARSATVPSYPTNKVLLTYQGSTIEVDAAGVKMIGTGGAEIDLQTTLVTIKNATTTLMTQMNNLITAIEGIQVTGNLPLTAASVTALEVVRTAMEVLLA